MHERIMASRVLNYLISMFYTLKHKQYFGPGLRIKGRPRIKINGTLSAGGNIIINSGQRYNPIGGDSCANIIVEESGYLGLGDNVGMSNCTIYCSSKIVIGSNVLIGGGVKIYDTDFHSLSLKERLAPYNGGADNGIVKTKVCIEDGVFIIRTCNFCFCIKTIFH